MPLNDIVNVVVTRNTQAITQPSFSTINLLSPDCNFSNRINFYSTADLSSVAADLCGGAGSYTYAMIEKIAAQSPSVNQIAVSAYAVSKHIWITGTMTAGTTTMIVNDIPISVAFNTNKATTMADIVTAIEANTDLSATYDTSAYTNDYSVITLSASTPKPISVKSIAVASLEGTLQMFVSTPITLTFSGTLTGGSILTYLNDVAITTNFDTNLATTIGALEDQLKVKAEIATTLSTSTTIVVVPKDGSAAIMDFDLTQAIGVATTAIAAFDYGSESVSTALTAIALENNNWYGALLVDAMSSQAVVAGKSSNSTARALQIAFLDWVEANKKFAVIASTDMVIINTSVTVDAALAANASVASKAHTAAYARAATFYSAYADTQFHDAAYLGKVLPLTPGSWTGKFKTLAGCSVDTLSGTQIINAEAKNCNIGLAIAGLNMTEQGNTPDGEWMDVIVFIDYITADIQANVFQKLSSGSKLPYDDSGIAAIKSAIQQSGEKGIFTGGLTPLQNDTDGNVIGGYLVTVPAFSSVSANDRNNRVLNNVRFTFYLAGAIHAVTINGVVTTA